ncbi:MAG: ABC transporter ATP-binding protein [Lachnospiraceae bacterium]
MKKTIRLDNVSKIFHSEQVLEDINIEFEEGQIYGIVGKNGSGKTVLLKIIAGYLKPSLGTVFVMDKKIGVDADFPDSMGLIIETPGFLSQYTAFQNLEYLANIRKRIGRDEIADAIKMVGLDPDSRKKVGKYSLGMRQRLGIAQAIMEKPEIILLDEPMNGLDKKGIEQVKQLLCELKEQGKTILMTSHYAEDLEICDEVLEMDSGKLIVASKKEKYCGFNKNMW